MCGLEGILSFEDFGPGHETWCSSGFQFFLEVGLAKYALGFSGGLNRLRVSGFGKGLW